MKLPHRMVHVCSIAAVAALVAGTTWADAGYKERTIKVSTTVAREHSIAQGMLKMASCAAERSGRKMKITLFPAGVLGGDPQVMQQLRTGTVDMMAATPSTLVPFMPAAGIFDMPFLVRDAQQADALLDGPAGQHFANLLPGVGLVHLAWTEAGFKHITSSKKPMLRYEDLAGQKIRVLQNNLYVDTFANWGAVPVTMAWGEIYSALENRAIDGQENSINSIASARFNEVQKFLTLTRHAYQATMTIYSKKLFDQLSPAEQETLRICASQGRDEQRRLNRQQEAGNLEKFKADGLKVNELGANEVARMQAKSKEISGKFESSVGPETFNIFMKEIAALR
jgi:tripartite ATP-independent transporter DctP family solute receptor